MIIPVEYVVRDDHSKRGEFSAPTCSFTPVSVGDRPVDLVDVAVTEVAQKH